MALEGIFPGGSAVLDALTSEEADLIRAGAKFIEPLGLPTLPGDVPVYHMVRGHETGTELTKYLNPLEIPAQKRLDKILAPGGGFGTYVEPGGKIFFSPDKSRVLGMKPEAGKFGQLFVDPEKYLFEGTLSGNQISRGLSPVEDIEGLLSTSQADEVFGTGRPSGGRGVQQTTKGKVVPANKFLGFDVGSLLGKTSRSAANLGKNTVADIIATPSLAKGLGEARRLGLVKLLGGAARFLGPASIPFDLAAGAEHLEEAGLATDPISKALSTVKSALAFSSASPYIGVLPYVAELGLGAAERAILGDYIRNEADAPGSTYNQALGSDSPVPDIPGFTEGLRPALKGILPEGDLTLGGETLVPPGTSFFDAEREAAFTKAFLKPGAFGLDPFTNEQIREARATYLRLTGEESPTYGPDPDLAGLSSDILQKDVAAEIESQVAQSLLRAQEGLTELTGDELKVASRSPGDTLRAMLASQTWSGVGGDEIPETVYNMPVGVPSEDVSDVTPVVTEDDLRALQANQQVYYADTVEPPTDQEIADSKRNIDRLIKEADKDKPMVSRVSQALTDYAYGKDVGELESIAALAEVDPTFNFEKYLDPTSQEVMDITSQVESFSEPTVEWTPPKKKEVKKVKGPTKKQKAATRRANQAANKKLLAEKKEARDIQKAKNAEIRAEKLAARESAKQARERKSAEQALAVQRRHEKMAREQELKRFEKQLRNAAEESRAAYLARKKQEDELREIQGYGWGDMFT